MDNPSAALSPFGVKSVGASVHDLPPEALAFLEQRGSVRVYRKGEDVQRHRVLPAHASWLLTGRLRSVVVQPDGMEQHLGWVMPQELFGIASVLVQHPARVTLLVDTSEARVLHFSREVLTEMILTLPEAGIGISVGLGRLMMQQYDVIDVNGPRTLMDRLRAVLVWWVKHHGIPALDGSVELWVAQNELANGVGASRQRVHMELQALRDLGEIELGYRKVIVRPLFFEKMAPGPGTTALRP